jgi:hypothetical protein
MGPPSEVGNASPVLRNAGWQKYRLWAILQGRYPDGTLLHITTQSPRFATKHGIRVGSSAREVLRKLGHPIDRGEMGREG